MEERVTSKLLSEIEPSMSGMRDQIQSSIGADIRRLVQEELAIQKMNEVKEQEAVDDEVEEPLSTKNNKIQKKSKNKNTKNIEKQIEEPEEVETSCEDEENVKTPTEPEKEKN